MYVCICNAVTDHQVRERAHSGVRSVEELTFQLGLGVGCGRCLERATQLLGDAQAGENCKPIRPHPARADSA